MFEEKIINLRLKRMNKSANEAKYYFANSKFNF